MSKYSKQQEEIISSVYRAVSDKMEEDDRLFAETFSTKEEEDYMDSPYFMPPDPLAPTGKKMRKGFLKAVMFATVYIPVVGTLIFIYLPGIAKFFDVNLILAIVIAVLISIFFLSYVIAFWIFKVSKARAEEKKLLDDSGRQSLDISSVWGIMPQTIFEERLSVPTGNITTISYICREKEYLLLKINSKNISEQYFYEAYGLVLNALVTANYLVEELIVTDYGKDDNLWADVRERIPNDLGSLFKEKILKDIVAWEEYTENHCRMSPTYLIITKNDISSNEDIAKEVASIISKEIGKRLQDLFLTGVDIEQFTQLLELEYGTPKVRTVVSEVVGYLAEVVQFKLFGRRTFRGQEWIGLEGLVNEEDIANYSGENEVKKGIFDSDGIFILGEGHNNDIDS